VPVRTAYGHAAEVAIDGDGDHRAPGAAITLALCGSWDHDGWCPLAPHHTGTRGAGGRTHLDILFATEPAREAEVRDHIAAALGAGELTVPDGSTTRWRLVAEHPRAVRPDESDHAARLVANPT
jgi:hypothetical protein